MESDDAKKERPRLPEREREANKCHVIATRKADGIFLGRNNNPMRISSRLVCCDPVAHVVGGSAVWWLRQCGLHDLLLRVVRSGGERRHFVVRESHKGWRVLFVARWGWSPWRSRFVDVCVYFSRSDAVLDFYEARGLRRIVLRICKLSRVGGAS